MRIGVNSYHRNGLLIVLGLLCVCVVVQMFGEPVTLLSEPTIGDMLTESESEDPSLLPPAPDLPPSGGIRLRVMAHSTLDLPVLATSIFHPPLT